MNFHTIVSHEHPDLDSILSIYLLKKYGHQKFLGVQYAKLKFYPAGILPQGKTPEELEAAGTLVVDTGGGRFDTHLVENNLDANKSDKCASVLVAEHLEIEQRPELKKLLAFSRLQDVEGKSLQSTDPVDHAFSLLGIIRGVNLTSSCYEETVILVSRILDALVKAEADRTNECEGDGAYINQCERIRTIVSRDADKTTINLVRWFKEDSHSGIVYLTQD